MSSFTLPNTRHTQTHPHTLYRSPLSEPASEASCFYLKNDFKYFLMTPLIFTVNIFCDYQLKSVIPFFNKACQLAKYASLAVITCYYRARQRFLLETARQVHLQRSLFQALRKLAFSFVLTKPCKRAKCYN